MRVLVLGGIAEAKRIATQLHCSGLETTYSVAGIVRLPKLRCQVISGGFTQFGGLAAYLVLNSINLLIDATHPYAVKISCTAKTAAHDCNIPCWRYQRPPWSPTITDRCFLFSQWDDLLQQLYPYKNRFITVGRVSQTALGKLTMDNGGQVLLRSAVAPTIPLPKNIHWLKAIGPYSLRSELKLMRNFSIDALVSKNSGGDATLAKMIAAKQLSVPVFMLDRPVLPAVERHFDCPYSCIASVMNWAHGLTPRAASMKHVSFLIR